MFDISKQSVELNCTECNAPFKVTVKQIAAEEKIKCRCGVEIQLMDKEGTNKKAIRDVNAVFKKLEDTFKKLGR